MSWTEKIDKPCEDCGVLLVSVSPLRKYCRNCAKKRQRAGSAEYRAKKRAEKVVSYKIPAETDNTKNCKDCIYWGGDYPCNYCCNYILDEGHSRPCPPGKDCTVKIPKNRPRTRRSTKGVVG